MNGVAKNTLRKNPLLLRFGYPLLDASKTFCLTTMPSFGHKEDSSHWRATQRWKYHFLRDIPSLNTVWNHVLDVDKQPFIKLCIVNVESVEHWLSGSWWKQRFHLNVHQSNGHIPQLFSSNPLTITHPKYFIFGRSGMLHALWNVNSSNYFSKAKRQFGLGSIHSVRCNSRRYKK